MLNQMAETHCIVSRRAGTPNLLFFRHLYWDYRFISISMYVTRIHVPRRLRRRLEIWPELIKGPEFRSLIWVQLAVCIADDNHMGQYMSDVTRNAS